MHHDAVAQLLEHGFAQLLVVRPDIPQIAAPVQEDDAVRAGVAESLFVEIVPRADIVRIAPGDAAQHDQFAQPDRTVADIGVIGKVEQRIAAAQRQVPAVEGIERGSLRRDDVAHAASLTSPAITVR